MSSENSPKHSENSDKEENNPNEGFTEDEKKDEERSSPGGTQQGQNAKSEEKDEKKEESLKEDKSMGPPHKLKTSMISGVTFKITENYELIKIVGKGAFGLVASALNKDTKQPVAIKKISNIFLNLYEGKRILREIKLLKFFKHHNIIKLLDIIKPESINSYTDICLVLELMNMDLEQIIKSNQVFTPFHIRYFLFQLLNGIYFLHSADVIHRDLKPNNLLVNAKCELKIADLGLARKFEKKRVHITDYVVTRWYRAPEIILSTADYTKAIDIWSAGCIFAELMGRTPLFKGDHYLDQLDRIVAILGTPKKDDLPYKVEEKTWNWIQKNELKKVNFRDLYPNFDEVAIDLLDNMLLYNPEKRFTALQCLHHPYFNEINNKEQLILDCKESFDWSFDNVKYSKETLQKAIYEESLSLKTIL